MRWDITHRTEYRYASPARESFNEVRLHPLTTQQQQIERFALQVLPDVALRQYRDFHLNLVHHFEIPNPHDRLVIESSVQARTQPPPSVPDNSQGFPLARISEAARSFRCYEFLGASKYVDTEPETWRMALDAIDGIPDAWGAARAMARFVHGHLKYSPNSTNVHTHMREALAQRHGVCQDFAHVMLGLCRSIKLPALYVSGYLATENASATHAWVEVFIPEFGWAGVDPTHNRPVDETYLKIAVGRDYEDVAPVSGRYKGTTNREMQVSVTIKTDP